MSHLRTREILDEWRSVAHAAVRPSAAPRPSGSAYSLGLVGTAAAVLILIVALSARGRDTGPGGPPAGAGGSVSAATPSATVPAATPTSTEAPSPSQILGSPSPAEAAAAKALVERYTNDLVRGDYAAAWAMLGPESQRAYNSLANYQAERSAYFNSVKGRFAVAVSPTDIGPLGDWLPVVNGAAIDPATAVLVEVTYPAISGRNAYSVYIVATLDGHLVIYSVR